MTDMLAEGAQIADYRIESVIGRGGMAVVYRAEDLRLGRKVALKLLAPEIARHKQFRDRFIREYRLAASIDHPNIIPIYEAGETDDLLYIVMRLVVGSDLREVLDRDSPLAPARTLKLLEQIGDALDAAHVMGLVHRDVKPGNILITTGSEHSEHVYLTDFGLTKRHTSPSGALTLTGHFLGTIDYVAPEQIAGKAVEPRTDIYALGCVLYECLTGQRPFHRDDDAAVLWAHLVEMPPPVTALRPDLGHEVDTVVARAMAKSPDDRYGSCYDLVVALRESLVLTKPLPRSGSGEDPWRDGAGRPSSGLVTAEPAEPVADRGPVLDANRPPASLTGSQHPSFPPGQFDLRGAVGPEAPVEDQGQAEPWEPEASSLEGPEEPEEATVRVPARRPRWLLAAIVAIVLILAVVAAVLFLQSRRPNLSAHFTRNDRVPFSFDYPGDWRQAGEGVNVVFSPRTDAASALFITNNWTGMSDLLRSGRSSVVGLYAARSFTEIDRSSEDTLQAGVAQLLPTTATFAATRQRVVVGGVLSDELIGDLADSSGSGATLRIWVYVIQGQQGGDGTVLLTFFAPPDNYDSQRALFDRILKTVDFR
jgi:serine/threonine protein kinase